MTSDEFDIKLTAYALNDPSLTPAERETIERRLNSDPKARAAVEETRSLGELLTTTLATEPQPAAAPALASTVVAKSTKTDRSNRWVLVLGGLTALAASVAFGILGVQYAMDGKPVAVNQTQSPPTTSQPNDTQSSTTGLDPDINAALDPKSRKNTKEFGDDKYNEVTPSDPVKIETATEPKGLPKPSPTVGSPPPPSFNLGGRGPASGRPTAEGHPEPFTTSPIPGGPPTGPGGIPGPGTGVPGGIGGPGLPGNPNPAGGTYSATPGGAAPAKGPVPGLMAPGAPPRGDVAAIPFDAKPAEADYAKRIDELEKLKKGEKDRFHYERQQDARTGGDQFRQLVENPFIKPEGMNALSTFGVDVDTASYSIIRNMLNNNRIPHPDAVRLEEMVNYFPYRDAPPEGADPFTVRVEMAECPWQPKHRLVRLALKAKPIENSKRPPSNLVFLLDVSGSMNEPNKLPLVKASMKLLLDQLTENDRVAIVVYAGASGVVLDSTNATKKDTIAKALDDLTPGGSTNGGSGIHLAYEQAVKNFIPKGTNRVILCTDGDWNVGTTGTPELIKLIEEKRTTGVFLSVFGFGMGNLRDEMMVQLAGKGNGNYGYIDTIAEAKKALVEQLSGTLVTVAKDVKVQIEFNPAKVAGYRLLGYEKRILAAEDFHNDKKDAGEMGAGHTVTALYELVPVGTALGGEPKVDGLRYQPVPAPEKPKGDDKIHQEAFVVKLRHKQPDGDKSTLREIPVSDVVTSYAKASEDFRFASSVAAFAMLLKNSPYKGQASFGLVEELASSSMRNDPGAYRAEFLQLVKKAKAILQQP